MTAPETRQRVQDIVADRTRTPRMFNAIAPRYDLLNHVLSFNVDHAWRRAMVSAAAVRDGDAVLDVATGTGDVAIRFARTTRAGTITGVDLSPGMLEVGRTKLSRLGLQDRVRLDEADALALPYPDASFDVVTIAFGLRNLPDYARGVAEMARVLRPGGRLVVLEFLPPRGPALVAYRAYLSAYLPLVGRLLSSSGEAYGYLAASIRDFIGEAEVVALFQRAELRDAHARRLSGGIAGLYVGVKS